jgi:hypothetical protein
MREPNFSASNFRIVGTETLATADRVTRSLCDARDCVTVVQVCAVKTTDGRPAERVAGAGLGRTVVVAFFIWFIIAIVWYFVKGYFKNYFL